MADRPYEIGYRRPPKHSQFKPGTSGYEGRKKKPHKSFAELFDQLLDEKVKINEQGKTRRIAKRELILRQLVNSAAGGEPRTLKLCLDVYARLKPDQGGAVRCEADEKLLAELLAVFPVPPQGDEP